MNNVCSKTDIIAALATPYGRSALAVIRVSGKGCIEKLSAFLTKPLEPKILKRNTFVSGEFSENLTAVSYKAPRSYTGEDVVELITHGNPIVVDAVMNALFGAGVRLAERGEFTERAFAVGKIDLTGCEALADIIDAETDEQLKYANARYNGEFTGLKNAEKSLVTALGDIEAIIHYGDELERTEVDDLPKEILCAIDGAIDILTRETESYNGGRILSDGLKVALVGAPNVGKSTLLNALVGADKAIVTDEAGTTRDTVEGSYIYKGRKFTVTDTAGLNDNATDKAELIGIERAKKAAECADAVIHVTANGVEPPTGISATFTVENKHDELTDENSADCAAADPIKISAKTGVNVAAVKERLYGLCPKQVGEICNLRQYTCAMRCLDACKCAKSEWEKPDGMEIVAAELYEACTAIAELYGEQADEKVISSVFERFCVGK